MLTRERTEAIRAMVALQTKRHAELGGPESSYQVAIDPSELAWLLDGEKDRKLGAAVRAAIEPHPDDIDIRRLRWVIVDAIAAALRDENAGR